VFILVAILPDCNIARSCPCCYDFLLMARSRSRKSLLEEVAAPFANLPPLAGFVAAALLAVIGWAAPYFAGTSVMSGIWLLFGRWLVWLLAVLVLANTLVGVWRRFIDRRTFDGTEDPARLTWSQFERLMAEFYRRKGAVVTPRGGPMADGGVDLNLTYSTGERLIVQCKHWKNRHVGVKPLRELWGVMGDEKANGAIFVTSGSFSADAFAFARGKRLELIDGPKLRGLLADVKLTQAVASAAEHVPNLTSPLCPRCESPMVLRIARRGSNTGAQFWGCSKYPNCQGTRPTTA
jgi:restriction system protein